MTTISSYMLTRKPLAEDMFEVAEMKVCALPTAPALIHIAPFGKDKQALGLSLFLNVKDARRLALMLLLSLEQTYEGDEDADSDEEKVETSND